LSKKAVSPLVAVIVLVLVILVVSTLLWLWITTILGVTKSTPKVKLSANFDDETCIVTIVSISREAVSLDKVQVIIIENFATKEKALLDDDRIFGNITEDCKLAFWDVDMDFKLSPGDNFRLKKDYASPGITLRLLYIPTKGIMDEITL
jgi:flagellin-like protein